MGFQQFDGKTMYVVDIKDWPPPLPVTAGTDLALVHYADALTQAIQKGMVTKPGKYAIEVLPVSNWWNVYAILESKEVSDA